MNESLYIRKQVRSWEYWLSIPTLVVRLLVTVARENSLYLIMLELESPVYKVAKVKGFKDAQIHRFTQEKMLRYTKLQCIDTSSVVQVREIYTDVL